VSEGATAQLTNPEEYEHVKKTIKDKIEAFTAKLFGN
jgi:hypothetical protein